MSASERAQTIRERMYSDMSKTLGVAGLTDAEVPEDVLDDLLDDAMHHVEHLLAEIEGMDHELHDLKINDWQGDAPDWTGGTRG